MIALIDADNVAFASAASAEEEDLGIAIARAERFVHNIMEQTKSDECELWLTGSTSFRKQVYPEYKANRANAYRPKWEKEVKQFFVERFGAQYTDLIEADDILGIRLIELQDKAVLCHLDKDLNQIVGKHYNWELNRKGQTVRAAQHYTVSPEEADYYFFYQLLVGDTTDNIKGVAGIGPKKATSILQNCETNAERLAAVEEYFIPEELDMNAQCVYIWRKHNDNWRNIIGDTTKRKE